MEPGKTVVALDGVGNLSRRGWSDRLKAYTREEFILGGSIILRLGKLYNIMENFATMRTFMIRAIPR